MANIISISRIFLIFMAAGLMFFDKSTVAYVSALILTILAFCFDGLDGYVARKFNETSKLGAVLDIMGDRITEYVFWIMLAHMGWIPVVFPIIAVTRGVITDSLRSVALEQGLIPFGEGSMLKDPVCQWICGSKFMKIGYAVAKAIAFTFYLIAYTPGMPKCPAFVFVVLGALAAEFAIILCVLRGIPVIFESKKFFVKEAK